MKKEAEEKQKLLEEKQKIESSVDEAEVTDGLIVSEESKKTI